ncbi:MAG: acyl carrier protein [Deferribacteres bacterium]|nr:acyl carrier protein [candidate division KSB1 bacterium]MCB9501349.1 acyl carrier protein [Deferribacteres bacterium]
MKQNDIFQNVQKILINNFDWLNVTSPIAPEHRLREDLELDSLAMVSLQVAVEDEFDIRFDPVETDLTEVFLTVGSLTKFIEVYAGNGD